MRNNKKNAFTLAEVMIVLLVLTILFAAFAPAITKRKKAITNNPVDIWEWSTRDYFNGPMDIYYDAGAVKADNTFEPKGSLFIGSEPINSDDKKAIDEQFLPYARVIIKSGEVTSENRPQRQIQLRFGRNNYSDHGQNAGTFFMDGRNILAGGIYYDLIHGELNQYPYANVGFGYNSLNQILNDATGNPPHNNTAYGNNALYSNYGGSNNVAIGYKAGYNIQEQTGNTIIGSNAGSKTRGNFNTLVGYNASSGTGEYNIMIGANTGNNRTSGSGNVGVGYNSLSSLTTGEYNVALGINSLSNLVTGSYNVAIGYNACRALAGQSNKTCIGYNAGNELNNNVRDDLALSPFDDQYRTYIGSRPKGDFGGDAVLEIHNVNISQTGSNALINKPDVKSNTTTIINGNLMVRGKMYLTIGNRLLSFQRKAVKVNSGTTKNFLGTYPEANTCAENQFVSPYFFNNNVNCQGLSFTSDRRLKNLKSKNNDGLNKIRELKIYNFTFKNDKNNKPQVGVIAQELQKVFPNSVSVDKDGYLTIRWDEMFYAAINALKELDNKISGLVNVERKLEKQITRLENENRDLQKQADDLAMRINKLKNAK